MSGCNFKEQNKTKQNKENQTKQNKNKAKTKNKITTLNLRKYNFFVTIRTKQAYKCNTLPNNEIEIQSNSRKFREGNLLWFSSCRHVWRSVI